MAGFHHGYLNTDNTEQVIAAINGSNAQLLLVGMGNPILNYGFRTTCMNCGFRYVLVWVAYSITGEETSASIPLGTSSGI